MTPDRVRVEMPTPWAGDVVVLWGWYGAKDQHLLKYARLHAERGRATVRAIAPPADVVLKREDRLRALAAASLGAAAELLAARADGTGLLFVHAFSNGGAFLYEAWLRARADVPRDGEAGARGGMPAIHGAIFDSSPAYMRPEVMFSVLASHTPSPALRALLGCAFGAWVAAAKASAAFGAVGPTPAELFWSNMAGDDSGVPALYLYSHADVITDARDLEELIAARRARADAPIDSMAFDGSEHVLHLKAHGEQYARAVERFVMAVARERLPATRQPAARHSSLKLACLAVPAPSSVH